MKTTIKGAASTAIVVQPGPAGTVAIDLTVFRVGVAGLCLTQDQIGALLFGLEAAAEASRIAMERAASVFHAPDTETPFPAMGGDQAHQCPPCHGDCSQGRTCPARGAVIQASDLKPEFMARALRAAA